MKSLFLILGNQLFPINNLKNHNKSTFFMCEDLGLCTYQKHHKLKLLLYLSSMRSFADALKNKKYKLKYFNLTENFEISYEKKLEKFIVDNKFKELSKEQKSLLGFGLNAPKDEFTRIRRRSSYFEEPTGYQLPDISKDKK